jgi:hypothetical protein
VKPGRVFVSKPHQLDWMHAGGGREIGALQPPEAKAEGGRTAGRLAADSGALAERGLLGAQRAREIAEEWRRRRGLPDGGATTP